MLRACLETKFLSFGCHFVDCQASTAYVSPGLLTVFSLNQEHLQLWFPSTWAPGLCCGFKGHTVTLMPKTKNLLVMKSSWERARERVDEFGLFLRKENRETDKNPPCAHYIFSHGYTTQKLCISQWQLCVMAQQRLSLTEHWVHRVHCCLVTKYDLSTGCDTKKTIESTVDTARKDKDGKYMDRVE